MTLNKSPGKRCNSCTYPIVYDIIPGQRANSTAAMHWRICEPNKNWPEFMLQKTPNKTPNKTLYRQIQLWSTLLLNPASAGGN